VTSELNADDRAVARELEAHIGTPVHLHRTARDVRLTLVFHSDEKLQEFLELLARA
jgi:ParB family chromosome partitioning protein